MMPIAATVIENKNTPESVIAELISRNQKPLETGEIVLLARAISDCICLKNFADLIAKDVVTQHKYSILEIIHFINGYTFINEDQEKLIFELIEEFVAWRLNLISSPRDILFISGDNYLIDEMSLITRFVDGGLLCSVGYIYNNAQYTYKLFKSLALGIGVRPNYSGDNNE